MNEFRRNRKHKMNGKGALSAFQEGDEPFLARNTDSTSVIFGEKATRGKEYSPTRQHTALSSLPEATRLQLVSLLHPIMPILNGLLGLLIRINPLHLH